MASARAPLLAALLLTVPIAGCVGYEDPGGPCSAQHAYAERLVFTQEGLYGELSEAMQAAEGDEEATLTSHDQGVWTGTRGAIEIVSHRGIVHGHYDASPVDTVPHRVQDSVLAENGPLWLDTITWRPNASDDQVLRYEAPEDPEGQGSLSITFATSNTTEATAAGWVRTLLASLFPEESYEPLEDSEFAKAWIREQEITPSTPADANGLIAQLIDAGGLEHRQAPFQDLGFPHTLGLLHLRGYDVGPYEGEIHVELSHDVRAIASGNGPTLVLEATPADRASVASLGSAPLGEAELTQRAQATFTNDTGIERLELAQAHYEEGGQASSHATADACTPMDALGQPLADEDARDA